jgi:hypothetical protein
MPYDNYDFEVVYTENLPEEYELIEPDIKCLQRTKSTKSGEMIEIQAFPAFLNRNDYSRAKKCKPSRQEQQKLNEANARKKVIRKVNANFTTNDYWGTYGWDFSRMPKSREEAYQRGVKYVDRVNYRRRKYGMPLMKYIFCIEEVEGNPKKGEPPIKYHMHMVMDSILNRDILEDLWDGGEYPQTRRLKIKDFGGLTGMATYIAKNPDGKKRWRQSKGLKQRSHKPSYSYRKFSKAKIKKMIEMIRNSESLKEVFEKTYPGYVYSDEYPCEIKRNEQIGGYYLYCRMYKKQFQECGSQKTKKRR